MGAQASGVRFFVPRSGFRRGRFSCSSNMALTHRSIAFGCGRLFNAVLLALTLLAVDAQRPTPFKKEAQDAELMITPNIMSAILFGIVWLMLFSAGFCCLFQVQTPSAYEEECLILNKQY